jgi:hypothetical protein
VTTTVTLGDHLTAQGVDATGLYSRGARVTKRATPATGKESEPTEFVPVRVEPAARGSICRITHGNGPVLEFGEWPEAAWLAALMSALASAAR